MGLSKNNGSAKSPSDATSVVWFLSNDELKQVNMHSSLVDTNVDRVLRSPLMIDLGLLEFAGDDFHPVTIECEIQRVE